MTTRTDPDWVNLRAFDMRLLNRQASSLPGLSDVPGDLTQTHLVAHKPPSKLIIDPAIQLDLQFQPFTKGNLGLRQYRQLYSGMKGKGGMGESELPRLHTIEGEHIVEHLFVSVTASMNTSQSSPAPSSTSSLSNHWPSPFDPL